jgi:cellobiose phosphorylase
MGSISVPQAVVKGKMSNSIVFCEKMIGALENKFIISPGASVTFNIAFGSSNGSQTTADIVLKVLAKGAADGLFKVMQENLTQKYNTVWVDTPDERLNYLFNGWIKRAIQLHTEVGTDTGKGFRDVMQAAWAVSSYDPEGARKKIITSLKAQFADGHTLRGWDPPDYHHYSDGPVWIAPALDSYLKETGDYDFLNTVVPYFDEGEASVWEHTLKSIRYATDDLGKHGLVRMHYGDWNDSLNMIGTGGIGESVWTSIAMIFCIKCALDIVRNVIKDEKLEKELIERSAGLDKAVQEHGWDGNWYLEAINDAGQPVGSHTETEGKVYLSPQAFSILAGLAGGERKEKVLKILDEVLECDYGSLGLTPAYRTRNPSIGRITWFVPGMWENASPYCHGTSFKIMADTYLGRGDKAFESMLKVLPDNPRNPCTHSGCPPYQVTNMYYGPEHPRAGQILYSWITGTSDWLFKTLTSHIIGVRADYKGLLIDPCLPSYWKKVSIRRSFHGASYRVTVNNPDGRQTGVKSITMDGKPVKGSLLPVVAAGVLHEVVVEM